MSRYFTLAIRQAGTRVVDGAVWFAATADCRVRSAAEAFARRAQARGDRGDVPGWVLVTLMTAGLVTALWVLARNRLTEVFDRAISSVTGQ
ncbi:MAG TPA: hypothetical protein VI248_27205 [Kineosporiaceae bacterium]